MSETVLIWIFGIMGGWLVILSAGLLHVKMSMAELRTIIIMTSKKAAEILHSPDNHHGLDDLLDKYISRHYELSAEEWRELMEKCEKIETDRSVSKSERLLAAFMAALCRHKLKLSWEPHREITGDKI